jgi:tetratricopeptide (TPR) repeat protein
LTEQFDKAKENYEAAIRKYPDYAEAYYGLARVLVRLGQADAGKEAMVTYRRLMAVRNPGRQGMDMIPETFETLCTNTAILYTDVGRIYHGHHRLAEAEHLWRRAAALSPENLECRRALAWLCRSQGRTDEAIQWLEEIAKLEPGNPTCWLEIGKLRLAQTQLRPAEKAYQKACEEAPRDARGFAALAALYLRSGQQSSEALKLARTAVELAPTAEHYRLLAGACQRNGDSAGEEDALRRAAELAPADPPKP